MPDERTPRVWLLRLMYAGVPAGLLIGVMASSVWGDNGVLEWQRLEGVRTDASAELGRVQRENQRLLRQMRLMDRDPVILERLVAEELGWGREGTTLVTFDDEE
ncbi:MAG: hypothetical protein ACI8PZ_004248 [Myxococcota bacterium]|jgi:hypothetical protein